MRNFKVTVDGQVYNVAVEEVFGAVAPVMPVAVSAPAAPVVPAAPAASVAPAAPAAPVAPAQEATPDVSGGTEIIAPMPGMIVGLKFANGAEVKKGDVVFVLEAMKMENDISSPVAGKVYYKVEKGNNVSSGDVVAVIK